MVKVISEFWPKLMVIYYLEFGILGMVRVRRVKGTHWWCHRVYMINLGPLMSMCQKYSRLSKFQKPTRCNLGNRIKF